jgi:hypothetical protein
VSILDVSAADIAQLSDDLLADLLGRLIEAEARASGIPLRAVVHGGHGNAPDRGIDARVNAKNARIPGLCGADPRTERLSA